MNAQELTQKIHRQLRIQNKEECLKLLEELRLFCQKSTAEEIEAFRKECYGGEAFVMLATSFTRLTVTNHYLLTTINLRNS